MRTTALQRGSGKGPAASPGRVRQGSAVTFQGTVRAVRRNGRLCRGLGMPCLKSLRGFKTWPSSVFVPMAVFASLICLPCRYGCGPRSTKPEEGHVCGHGIASVLRPVRLPLEAATKP